MAEKLSDETITVARMASEKVWHELARSRIREARLEKALRHVLSSSGVRLDVLNIVREALEET
jgi:hypothetical protein